MCVFCVVFCFPGIVPVDLWQSTVFGLSCIDFK